MKFLDGVISVMKDDVLVLYGGRKGVIALIRKLI